MTMRVLLIVFATLAVTAIPLFAPQRTLAEEGHFTLYNGGRTGITHVYVSPSEQGEWGDDLLGREVLNPGESAVIYFLRYDPGSCLYDLRFLANAGAGEGRSFQPLYGISPGNLARMSADNGAAEPIVNRV